MSFQLMVGTITCLLTVIWGEPFIRVLRLLGLGKNIRERGADAVVDRHLETQGTPTFGGLLFIVPALATTVMINAVNVLTGRPEGRSILVPLAALVLFGLLGAVDDWEGIHGLREKAEGLSERAKFAIQVVLAAGIALALYFPLGISLVSIPMVPERIDLGLAFIPIAVFIILGTSNSANFTDGLDCLAGNVSVVAFGAYGVIAFLQGQ
ncbi:MAG: phospho-N-acetylmuramoyl-pentapeptide-transferase, partial [Anaerolineae bacterium]